MKTIHKLILGSIVVIILIVGYLGWLLQTKPSEEAISAQVSPVKTVKQDLLSQPELKELKSLDRNGDLPVAPGEIKRDNPFDKISQ